MPILYFVLVIIVIRYIIPLCDQLLSWILTFIEVKKGQLMIKQQECEKTISDIVVSMETPHINQIGFKIPTEPEEEENDE